MHTYTTKGEVHDVARGDKLEKNGTKKMVGWSAGRLAQCLPTTTKLPDVMHASIVSELALKKDYSCLSLKFSDPSCFFALIFDIATLSPLKTRGIVLWRR